MKISVIGTRYFGLVTGTCLAETGNRVVCVDIDEQKVEKMHGGRVICAFIGQALRGEDLTVFGEGLQTSSFCYVDDLIDGIYRLLFSNYVYPVNIVNPNEITISDFAEEIIQLTGTEQK